MNDRPALFERSLAERLELALAGAMLAIVPLGAITRGTEHYAPALIVVGIALAYIALAVGSALSAVHTNYGNDFTLTEDTPYVSEGAACGPDAINISGGNRRVYVASGPRTKQAAEYLPAS
jgi:hypothetical protein